MNVDPVKLRKFADTRGDLVIIEAGKDLPFEIKRSYFVYNTDPAQPRGFHAHKALQQVFVCVSGGCEVLLDDGVQRKTVSLNAPDQCLYVGPMIWHEMHNMTTDCIFVAYASALYDENDYIRNYEDFMRLVNG